MHRTLVYSLSIDFTMLIGHLIGYYPSLSFTGSPLSSPLVSLDLLRKKVSTAHPHENKNVSTTSAPDLWQLPPPKLTARLAERVEGNFYARCPPEERPYFLQPPKGDPGSDVKEKGGKRDESADIEKRDSDDVDIKRGASADDTVAAAPEVSKGKWQRPRLSTRPTGTTPTTRKGEPKYDRSLLRALHATFWVRWWSAGVARLCSDTLKTTAPLVNKAFLRWLSESYIWYKAGDALRQSGSISRPAGVGHGIGLAFGLFLMQEVSSLVRSRARPGSVAC
jgi:ATP-binding cassette, subfamily C (CFTR/MRP), member 1